MTHYSKKEWLLFVQHRLTETKEAEMEEHLAACDHCHTIYLDAVETELRLNDPPYAITSSFSSQVMQQIKAVDRSAGRKKKVKKKTNILVYYTAAACLTLLLMGSGVFNILTSSIPKTSAEIFNNNTYQESVVMESWTERLSTYEVDYKLEIKLDLFNWREKNEKKK
ncbi:MAG: hypothetical protein SCK28_04015 [Bacillota bacterium]|nr:hypothetical protein [Bacillota bacterium]